MFVKHFWMCVDDIWVFSYAYVRANHPTIPYNQKRMQNKAEKVSAIAYWTNSDTTF